MFVNRVQQYVAQNADVGLMQNAFCDTFYRIPIEEFEPEKYFEIFEKDSGVATCGLTGQLMVKMLIQNGIDAYTYNFGFNGTRLAHIVVLVKNGGQLLIFDPYMNYALLNSAGNNMGLVELLHAISRDSLQVAFTADTVLSDVLVDHQLLSPAYRELMTTEACNGLRSDKVLLRDSVFKLPFYRCFTCERDRPCVSFVRDFETKLSETTGLQHFHEGFALKINEIYGAADHVKINAEIDSLITNSAGIQRLIRAKQP